MPIPDSGSLSSKVTHYAGGCGSWVYGTPRVFRYSWLYERAGTPFPFVVSLLFPLGLSLSKFQNHEIGSPLDLTKAFTVSMSCRLVTSSWVSARPISM